MNKKYIILTFCVVSLLSVGLMLKPPLDGCWNRVYNDFDVPDYDRLLVFDSGKVKSYDCERDPFPEIKKINVFDSGSYKKIGNHKYTHTIFNGSSNILTVGWFYMVSEQNIDGVVTHHKYKRNLNIWATNSLINRATK